MNIFYSGFSLENDKVFFEAFIDKSQYNIAGFSYGAIKAFEDALQRVRSGKRVDRLQLLSPAFFQTQSPKFKKLQLYGFTKDRENYIQQFLQLCFKPYNIDSRVKNKVATKEELSELLYHTWSESDLTALKSKGVVIEVYLGGRDAIVDADAAKEFFLPFGTVTYIKDANHFLQTK